MEYKASFFKSHRNLILLILIFTVIFGFRIYYDYQNLQPVMLPVLKKDYKEGTRINSKDIELRTFYKMNLSDNVVTSKKQLENYYAKTTIIADQPIYQRQVLSKKEKFGYLAELPSNKRVIPLPSDVNSSGINIDDRIEITSSPKNADAVLYKNVYALAIVRDKIDAKGISYDEKTDSKENAQRGNVPKVLMVEVTENQAKDIEDSIGVNEQINVRLVPPSYYERVSN